ncbi:MAG: Hpt domain-containing protein [Burkholderiales bacterium]|nr:Hpt domain-containing protein [Burkholderiales bacterium]
MAIDIPLELDPGPITWVKAEIEASLGRVLEAIATLRSSHDVEQQRLIARELHAVAGAFELVGIDGLAVLVREFEWHFAQAEAPPSTQALDIVERGVRRLLAHLQEVAGGAPAVPVRFLPEYLELGRLRDAQLRATDLFFPDLSRKPPRGAPSSLPAEQVSAHLLRQRRQFQRALLSWLRGDPTGLTEMGKALKAIEEVYPLPAQRAFWWTSRALVRALEVGLLEPANVVKQLLARIDLQIRRFVEGSTRVADRLRREVLFHIARGQGGDPLVDEVKALYELDVLLPKRVPVELDYVAIQPILERLRSAVAIAKERWSGFYLTTEDRNEFASAVSAIAEETRRLGRPEFARLGEGLLQVLPLLQQDRPSDDLSIEVALILILLETATEQIATLPRNFSRQVEVALARLDHARRGEPIPPALREDREADSLTRKAQERATVAQVVREIRVNLRAVEQALDAVFRDRSATEELANVPALLAQVSGAMQILGWTHANEILTEISTRLMRLLRSEEPVEEAAINEHADVLAGIAFYIDARAQRDEELPGLLADLERRLRGERREEPPAQESVEEALDAKRRKLRTELGEGGDEASVEAARDTLLQIKQDAQLIADEQLVRAADSALAALDQGQMQPQVLDRLFEGQGREVPVPEPSVRARQLASAEADVRDEALLDIFREEAGEVIVALDGAVAALHQDAGDRQALLSIRRSFHTLKGSARMVGLAAFGEAAWQVEKVLNRILESERPVTAEERQFIASASECFTRWVDDLRQGSAGEVDPELIGRLVATLEEASHARATRQPTSMPRGEAAEQPAAAAQRSDGSLGLAATEAIVHAGLERETADADQGSVPGVSAAPETATLVPTAEATATPEEPIEIAYPPHAWSGESEEVVVEGVSIARPLFAILVDEARVHLQTLEQELAELQFDPSARPSAAMIRAAHTLCGIHRTAGLASIGDLAGEIERVLVALRNEEGVSSEVYSTLASAVAALRTASLRIQTQTPSPEQERRLFTQALEAMRSLTARLGARSQDAVSAAMADADNWPESPTIAPAETTSSPIESADDRIPEPAAESRPKAMLPSEPGEAKAESSWVVSQIAEAAAAQRPSNVIPIEIGRREGPAASATRRSGATSAQSRPGLGLASTVEAPQGGFTADPLADVRDDIDEQILPIFLNEAQELYPLATEQARAMRANPTDATVRAAIKRTLHTLKGSARMAGAMRLGELTHQLETRIVEAPERPDEHFFESVEETLDDMAYLLERHTRGEHNVVLPRYLAPVSETPWAEGGRTAGSMALAEAAQPAAHGGPEVAAASRPPSAGVLTLEREATAGPESAFVRVRSDTLETVADEAGEVAISRARIENELKDIRTGLSDLTAAVVRLRAQLRELEIQGESQIQSRLDSESPFDPLEFDRYTRFQELTRSLVEGVNDVATVQQNLVKNLASVDSALAAQMRLLRSVQMRLQALRTVPFSTVADRLYRVLRQTAKELGKRANLDIRGERIEIDRGVLDRLSPLLDHLVRNAVAHGIEAPSEREALGKPVTGELALTVAQQGNEIVIELADDGAGLPFERIEARARALGLIAPDAQPTEADLVELIFQAGFSTAETVSAIAGRGVGMDIVRSEVTALGGRIEVHSERNRGTRFVLRVPVSLAVTQALLVRTGDSIVGLPAALVETVRRVPLAECERARQSGSIEHAGQPIRYALLTPLYDKTPLDAGDQRMRSVVIVRSGEQVAAFEVDAVIGNQEIVAKPYGPQLARVRGLAGLTVLGDGTIVMLSNPLQLLPAARSAESVVPERAQAGARATSAKVSIQAAPASPPQPSVEPPRAPLVLVVDDSLTVRKITSRLLEREGYRVLTAKDGLDALEVLTQHEPQVILLDIEMPRMDGFEFTRTIRSSERERRIPIIMITSRTADKHRTHARELGVDEYLGKPYQDEQLLDLVARYTGRGQNLMP